MRIDEHEEYQGLTAELLAKWLIANGWQRMPAQDTPRSECWVRKGGAGGTIWIGVESSAETTLSKLATWMECSVQDLLREINPRMRKGMPSEAAWRAHGEANGLWLCLWGEIPTNEQHWELFFRGRPFVTKLRKYDDMWEWGIRGLSWADCPEMPHGSDFLFWPCDANGNKTRWPTDAEGNML